MAGLSIFAYRSGETLLHRLDPRTKLMVLFLANGLFIGSGYAVLAAISLAVAFTLHHLGISLPSLLYRTRVFLVFLLFIFLSRAVFIPGSTVFEFGLLRFSSEGISSGLAYCWKLAVILYAGIVFIASTTATQIRLSLEWFLKPFPFVPERRVGVMIGLLVRFLPLMVEKAADISDAQKARGVEKRKNPVYRLVSFSLPFMRSVFRTADELVIAMEARCYSEHRTNPPLRFGKRDVYVLAAAAAILIGALAIQ